MVGSLQTHGVGLDFVRALVADPTRLRILGDGTQSKSYIHVDDVIDAMLAANGSNGSYGVYNVATGDYVTVAEIADLAAECVGLEPKDVRYEYTGGERGWKGDVPVVRLSIERIRGLGWAPSRTSRGAARVDDGARRGRAPDCCEPSRQGAVFLDRDGTLIRALVNDGLPGSIRDHEALELEPGAADACDALVARGFPLVAVTNQPEIARGTQSAAAVERISQRLRELLQLAEIVVCPHDDEDGCPCRKPKPGMLVAAAESRPRSGGQLYGRRSLARRGSGRRAGCTTVFLNRQYSETVPEHPDVTVRTIGEAAAWIVAQEKR